MTIKLEVQDNEAQHFTVSGDEPFRVEVSNIRGRIIAHVYAGFDGDEYDEPVGAADFWGVPVNTGWEWNGPEGG